MRDWWCTICRDWKDSWAEKQFHEPTETYRRDIRCWSCDNWGLTYTDSQKTRYKELVKERTYLSAYLGYVEEVERFSTWWSNNIATTVVYYNGYYRVFLLVYDPVFSFRGPATFPRDHDCSYWGEHSRGKHSYSSDAKSEANWLRDKLISSSSKYYDNPILLVHPSCDSYDSYYSYTSNAYVEREEVGNADSTHLGIIVVRSGSIPSNLDSYFRPLDVIKVKEIDLFWGVRYWHFGVYLGNGEICEFTREENGVRKVGWSGFLRKQIGELYKHHPIVPFKHCDKISRQVAICVDERFREDRYDLHNRNCEHFANMIGFGINYSEQVYDNKANIKTKENSKAVAAGATLGISLLFTGVPNDTINNDKGSTIKLTNEINETDGKLSYSSSDHWWAKEIKERYLQEVPPKQECRIM